MVPTTLGGLLAVLRGHLAAVHLVPIPPLPPTICLEVILLLEGMLLVLPTMVVMHLAVGDSLAHPLLVVDCSANPLLVVDSSEHPFRLEVKPSNQKLVSH